MDFLTLNATPKQCLTKRVDEKRGKKEEAERRGKAQAFQKAAENRNKKPNTEREGNKREACSGSEVVGNKSY